MGKLQPAVKKETMNIAIYTGVGTVVMFILFFVLCKFIPDTVPFDYTVILGGVGGFIVAVLNFFLMAVTVQKVASEEDEKRARSLMKLSFSRRMLLQVVWLIVALAAPCFFWVYSMSWRRTSVSVSLRKLKPLALSWSRSELAFSMMPL